MWGRERGCLDVGSVEVLCRVVEEEVYSEVPKARDGGGRGKKGERTK